MLQWMCQIRECVYFLKFSGNLHIPWRGRSLYNWFCTHTHTPTLTIDEVSPSLSGSSSATEGAISATSSEMRLEVSCYFACQCLTNNKKRARESLVHQAERMVKRSRVEHVAGNLLDNVTIPIPLVDRGRGDPINIMGVILDRDDNDM